jgi:ubiquinone/menaquinone biosynthesis C-methylase UbiE
MSNNSKETNSYVLDPENPVEMARLINLDRFTTQNMGGPLAGLSTTDISGLHNVLDLACGPGGWVLDVAFDQPTIEAAGVDISRTMIDYANARARTQQLPNASFGVMDITEPLDFADGAFDLVNARYLFGALPRKAWTAFIEECTRLLRPGGILRLTEPVDIGITTSPALEQLNALAVKAMWLAGYGFSPDGRTLGVTTMLPRLLCRAGYQNIRHRAHVHPFSEETGTWADYYRNTEIVFQTIPPLLIQTGVTTQEEVDRLYQQMLIEIHQHDFCGMSHTVTTLGYKP